MSSSDQVSTAKAKLVSAVRVRPAAKDAFIEWNGRVSDALHAFPGFTGREVIPPQSNGVDQWVFVTHFDSLSTLDAWRASGVRAQLFDEAKPLHEDDGIIELAGNAATQYHVENSVTEVILERVKRGQAEAYRAWSNRIQQAQAKLPGYQGGYTQPPAPGEREWMTLVRFSTVQDLNRWMNSPERKALIQEAAPLVERAYLHRIDASFPGWAPTDPATGQNPPNWKTTMLVLLGLYPIVSLELADLMAYLSGLRPAFATFVGNLISVSLVAYVTMPLLVRAMRWWLFPKPDNTRRTTLAGAALIVALFVVEIAVFWKIL